MKEIIEVPLSYALRVPQLDDYTQPAVKRLGFSSLPQAILVLTNKATHQAAKGGKRRPVTITKLHDDHVECHDHKGAFRALPHDKVFLNIKGPRGGDNWVPLTEVLDMDIGMKSRA